MKHILTYFANTEATSEKADMFVSLGIDWKMLLLQTIAFLILLWFLKKYVYPALLSMLDKHDEEVNAAYKAAKIAEEKAATAESKIDTMLTEARAEAKDIVATAKKEANAMVADAEEKGRATADQLIASAHAEISQEVLAAKKALHNEAADLVVLATKKVVGDAMDAKLDKDVINTAIEESV